MKSDRQPTLSTYMRYIGVISLLGELSKDYEEDTETRHRINMAINDFSTHNEDWTVKRNGPGWWIEPPEVEV